MGKLLMINGSPRAPRSNSKKYGEIIQRYWKSELDIYSVIERKHEEICGKIVKGEYENIIFIFPLYVDALPAVLMSFMKQLEREISGKEADFLQHIKVHVLINCGFLEPEQNDTALEIFRHFCRRNGLRYGMTLRIAAGEAILTTPFAFLVKRKIRHFI